MRLEKKLSNYFQTVPLLEVFVQKYMSSNVFLKKQLLQTVLESLQELLGCNDLKSLLIKRLIVLINQMDLMSENLFALNCGKEKREFLFFPLNPPVSYFLLHPHKLHYDPGQFRIQKYAIIVFLNRVTEKMLLGQQKENA